MLPSWLFSGDSCLAISLTRASSCSKLQFTGNLRNLSTAEISGNTTWTDFLRKSRLK